MNNRFGRDRDNYREYHPSRNAEHPRHWTEREDERAQRAQPYLQDDDAQSYDREFERDGARPPTLGANRPGNYGQRPESRPGWYSRGNTGTYGSGGGGYHGGHASGGYGDSTGTDYSTGSHGGYAGGEVGYGRNQGARYGTGSGASRGAIGSGIDQGYHGRGFGSPDRDLQGEQRGGFAGRGPKGYTRTDERIREDVCDRLSVDDDVDATEIEVRVQDGEVTLEGTVETRRMKHRAENLADDVAGVKDVHNHLRVLKGFLHELKDKVSGQEEGHYANTGTKNAPAVANGHTAQGRA